MATSFIPINPGQRLGARLRAAVDTAARNMAELEALYAIAQTQVTGSDYSLLEAQFGLQAGQGATVFTLLQNVVNDLTSNAHAVQLTTQCG